MASERGVDRFTLGPLHNPVRGFLHGSGAACWLWLAAELGTRAEAPCRGALLVCAFSQAALFAASSLYHSLPWPPVWKARMGRLDHSMIYVKIAGTLTPLAWLALAEPWRTWLIALAWAIALLGTVQKLGAPRVSAHASLPFQVAQALLGIPVLLAFGERFPGMPQALLVTSAALYATGALCFVLERPRLWPRVFSFHEVFHVFVVAGSGAHYALLVNYLAR